MLVLFYEVFKVHKHKNEGLIFYLISGIILILFAGLRYRVGIDTINYMSLHEFMPQLGNIFNPENILLNRELGWILISAIAKLFGESFYFVQIIVSIIVNSSILVFIYKNTIFKFTGIIMYFVIFYTYLNFEIMRESVSISIFLAFGIEKLVNRKWLSYVIISIICFFFHTSAFFLFLLPFIFLWVERNKKYNFLVISTLLFLIGQIVKPFFINVLLGSSLGDLVNSRIELYSEYEFSLWGNILAYLSFIIFPSALIFFLKSSRITLKSFLFSYCILGALVGVFTIFFRLLNYLTPFLILTTTELLHQVLKSEIEFLKKTKVSLLFILFIVFFNYKLFLPALKGYDIAWYVRWYPYYSIFNEEIDSDREYIANF